MTATCAAETKNKQEGGFRSKIFWQKGSVSSYADVCLPQSDRFIALNGRLAYKIAYRHIFIHANFLLQGSFAFMILSGTKNPETKEMCYVPKYETSDISMFFLHCHQFIDVVSHK